MKGISAPRSFGCRTWRKKSRAAARASERFGSIDAEGIEVSEDELLEALAPPAGEKGKPEKLLKRIRAEGRDALLIEEIRMRKAAELIVEAAKPIEMDRAEARETLWTPEGEGRAAAGDLWTPGDDD